MKDKSEYKKALTTLREENADKLSDIFKKMYSIVQTAEEDKDAVNAAKVCVSLLGVPRPTPEKAKEPPPEKIAKKDFKVPELSSELKERLKNIYAPTT
jgi:hypothetical protein